MTRNELLDIYVNKWGLTVVPVRPGEKFPALKTWKEYSDGRKPTPEELREWFKDPNMGVGVLTGKASGILMVDEDSYKAQGKKLDLQSPLIVNTGGGGKHYYFKYIDGVHNSVNHKVAVDIRGDGGFAVLPPSVHASGKQYEWVDGLPSSIKDLPTIDDALVTELIKKHQSGQAVKIQDYIAIPEGGRDDSLLRMALSLVNKHSEADAWVLINSVNSTYNPPLADRDVERIFKQALTFVKNNPKKTADELEEENALPLEVLTAKQAEEKYEELMTKYGGGVGTGYQVLDEYFKFVPQQLYMISAPTHVGKTTLVLNMAGRLARAGVNVALASLEQGVFVIPRLRSMFGSMVGMDNLHFIVPDKLPTPDDFIRTFADEANRPKILIVDHLHYFERGNRGATEEMDRLVVAMQSLAKQLEIPVVCIAHVRKLKDDKPPTMDDLKDSSSLSQIPAVVAMMNRDRNDEQTIKDGGPIFSNTGTLYIYKNRIFGRTGSENFELLDNGEIIFARGINDQVNPQAEQVNMLEGIEDLVDD